LSTTFYVAVNPTVTTTYTLVSITNGNGCVQTSGFGDATAQITVRNLPQGSLSANGPFCSSGSGQLIWTATSGTEPFTVVYNDGVASRTQTNVTSGMPFNVFTSPVTNTTIYSLVSVTDANGCVRLNGFTGGTATIMVNALPTASAGSNTPQCSGSILSLSSSGGTSYSWTGPNSFTSTSQNPSISNVTTSASGTYTVTVSNASGCVATATTNVTVNALPTPTFINPSTSSCANDNVMYETQAGQSNYVWTVSGDSGTDYTVIAGSLTTNSNTVMLRWLTSGSKTVTVKYTNSNGCVGNDATSVITVNPLPATGNIVPD